jgi:hypothetical protein
MRDVKWALGGRPNTQEVAMNKDLWLGLGIEPIHYHIEILTYLTWRRRIATQFATQKG